MKNFICSILILCISQSAFCSPNCDWTQIKKNPDNTYTYSATLNLCVGNLVQDDAVKTQQVADLTKAIQLKDLAIQMSDSRVALWQKSSNDELDRVTSIESNQKHNDILYFGLGLLTAIGAAYAAGQVIHR